MLAAGKTGRQSGTHTWQSARSSQRSPSAAATQAIPDAAAAGASPNIPQHHHVHLFAIKVAAVFMHHMHFHAAHTASSTQPRSAVSEKQSVAHRAHSTEHGAPLQHNLATAGPDRSVPDRAQARRGGKKERQLSERRQAHLISGSASWKVGRCPMFITILWILRSSSGQLASTSRYAQLQCMAP